MNKIKIYKLPIIIAILVIAGFFIGLYIGSDGKASLKSDFIIENDRAEDIVKVDMSSFWQVWDILNTRFVATKDSEEISDEEKLYGAIQGLTSSFGDPYTVFMPPEESKMFESDISGNFEGVGMEIGIRDDILTVVAPLKGTPAFKAGVKSGDKILEIDGKSTDGMSVDKAVKLIRGKAGTEVNIRFYRDGKDEPFNVKIVRAIIDVPTLETEIKDDVFIIKLYNFYATAPNLFRNALREFVDSGKAKLVLDLRGNPGGYLEGAVDIASWFLPVGKVIVRESFGEGIEEYVYRSKGYDIFNENLKMAILVNEGSASASEILAGALQEHDRAKLVGTKTFGKGSVQELLKITSDTSLKVTIARWLTPKGNSISEEGLTPDFEVKITAKDDSAGIDPQLDRAIEILK